MHDQIKLLAFFALANQVIAGLEPSLIDRVSKLASFVSIHVLKNANLLEKFLVFFAFSLRAVLYDVVKGPSIESPEFCACFGVNRCSSWSIIE